MRTWLATFLFLGSACNSIMGGILSAAEPKGSSTEGHIVGIVGSGQAPPFVRHPEVIYGIQNGNLVKLTTDGATQETLQSCFKGGWFSPSRLEIAMHSCSGLVILDLQTGTWRRLVIPSNVDLRGVRWSKSGRALQIEYEPQRQDGSLDEPPSASHLLWLDTRTGEATSPEPLGTYRRAAPDCGAKIGLLKGACGGLDRVESETQTRPLFRIEGCHHDGLAPPQGITNYFFSDDCRLLVFNFNGGIFVGDVETGYVSHLMRGELWRG